MAKGRGEGMGRGLKGYHGGRIRPTGLRGGVRGTEERKLDRTGEGIGMAKNK